MQPAGRSSCVNRCPVGIGRLLTFPFLFHMTFHAHSHDLSFFVASRYVRPQGSRKLMIAEGHKGVCYHLITHFQFPLGSPPCIPLNPKPGALICQQRLEGTRWSYKHIDHATSNRFFVRVSDRVLWCGLLGANIELLNSRVWWVVSGKCLDNCTIFQSPSFQPRRDNTSS